MCTLTPASSIGRSEVASSLAALYIGRIRPTAPRRRLGRGGIDQKSAASKSCSACAIISGTSTTTGPWPTIATANARAGGAQGCA